jgi:sugar phosphate isomerase/epimerase
VELVTGGEAGFADTGPDWERGRASFVRQMELSRAAGARTIVATQGGSSVDHGHFSREPPIDVQLERMIASFRELIVDAERLGIVIALENHLDYRCSELAIVLAAVDSPWLRMNFDFANSLAVIEDPVDAARAVAPWTVMTHVKDMRVQAKTIDGEPRIMGCPVGDGSVDIGAILALLESDAPRPAEIQHCLEVCVPAAQDPDLWVRKSMQWLTANHGSVFRARASL